MFRTRSNQWRPRVGSHALLSFLNKIQQKGLLFSGSKGNSRQSKRQQISQHAIQESSSLFQLPCYIVSPWRTTEVVLGCQMALPVTGCNFLLPTLPRWRVFVKENTDPSSCARGKFRPSRTWKLNVGIVSDFISLSSAVSLNLIIDTSTFWGKKLTIFLKNSIEFVVQFQWNKWSKSVTWDPPGSTVTCRVRFRELRAGITAVP